MADDWAGERRLDLRSRVHMLWRRRVLIVLVAAACGVGGSVLSERTIPRSTEALDSVSSPGDSIAVRVADLEAQQRGADAIIAANPPGSAAASDAADVRDALTAHIALLRSQAVSYPVVERDPGASTVRVGVGA